MPALPLSYRYRIERRTDGYRFRFPELPEADFTAATPAEGRAAAPAKLSDALFERLRTGNLPAEARPHRGEGVAYLLASAATKLLFIAKAEESGLYPAELGRRLGMTPQEAQRIFKLGHVTKIDTLQAALLAAGWRLKLSVDPVEK
ncbi:hypothetical protein [Sutterella sp.]|uniref:hypothetical protein n=1 Tax=Sutterella sp. TaxID=1981025 RepID=UPI0026E0B9E5|nr:hypothetical protein [Sutterella sp.]MDO5530574.1 hypothetical protein [Sutterella sp.]